MVIGDERSDKLQHVTCVIDMVGTDILALLNTFKAHYLKKFYCLKQRLNHVSSI